MVSNLFYHPDRPSLKFRPIKAISHFRQLVRNKEDTGQVFHIFDCLPPLGFAKTARTFIESAKGRRLMASEPFLPSILDNHSELEGLPAGSVGRAYLDFMRREGLSAAGLVAEYEKVGRRDFDDQIQWYGNRLRDTHDLMHILTGYGRDALGEQCLLAFSNSQMPSLGTLFIAWAGANEVRKDFGSRYPIFGAVREGQRHGHIMQRIVHQDIRALLAEPLEGARKRLGVAEPAAYRRVHMMMRADGVDPYAVVAPVVVEAEAAMKAA